MPRTMMTSLMRPVMNSSPASSMKPRSPVRSQDPSSPSIHAPNLYPSPDLRSACVRIVPIALADVRPAHPPLADAVGFEPPPGFRIDDRDALADNISAAADHTMRVLAVGSSGNLMALKRVAADGP